MSTAAIKQAFFGGNFKVSSPADALHLFDKLKGGIKPEAFSPFVAFTGGVSIVGGPQHADSMTGILIALDWISLCQEAGANVKNALTCLASNYDDHMGMVALALEAGSISHKPGTASDVYMDINTFVELIDEVFVKNYGGVRSMAGRWSVGLKEANYPKAKTRSVWSAGLGYDVLIHPTTLEPCKLDGKILQYKGLITDEIKAQFKFVTQDNQEILQSTFPS